MTLGFWRPLTLPTKLGQKKKTEKHKSVQQKDNKGEYMQQKLSENLVILFVNILENKFRI